MIFSADFSSVYFNLVDESISKKGKSQIKKISSSHSEFFKRAHKQKEKSPSC